MLITADHGNCDEMKYQDGSPQTSHSKANVPFSLIQKDTNDVQISKNSALKDVAPTILYLLGIEKHAEMTGNSIFK
jgi:2,3-bisphosphoglycerate-independent phosphoglycerate mutase